MPIRNEERYIERSLGAVLAQDYPARCMEILVVDGMSDDGTTNIISDLGFRISDCEAQSGGEVDIEREDEEVQSREESPVISDLNGNDQIGEVIRGERRNSQFPVRILDNPSRIVPAALNIGLQHARGEVVIRVDGHCEIAPDYVRRCIEALGETDADCVGGPMVTRGETWAARGIALAQSSFFGVGGVAFRTGHSKPGYVDTVAFGAYRRDVFNRIGGFDEELVRNQDDEFNFRLTQSGGKIWLDPSIRSAYYSRASLGGLWCQYFRYGFYKVRVIQKRRAVPSWRHMVPGVFLLGLTGSFLMAAITRNPLWAGAVMGPYLLANLGASVWTSIRRGCRYLPLMPLCFLIIHMGYGFGFWIGLVKLAKAHG